MGEPLKGTVGCQAFSRNPKGSLGRIFILCSQIAHARALIGAHCHPVDYLRGLVTGGGARNSLRVMETTAKAN